MEQELPLASRLNLETAPISWPELERFFARGRVLRVNSELDLIDVAVALHDDDIKQFQQWTDAKQVEHLQDATAKQWVEDDSSLWGVVIAPWVLVQDRRSIH